MEATASALGVDVTTSFPTLVKMRDYQERALEQIRQRIQQGARRLMVVSPTGSGKGTMAAFMLCAAWQRELPSLFFAHRWKLIDDMYGRVRAGGCDSIGTILSGDPRRNATALVQIASTDSLRGKLLPPARVVIHDEAHRSANPGSRSILESYPDAIICGLTATPLRLDGKGFDDLFDDLIVVAQPPELINAGWIVRARVFTVPQELLPDVDGVRTTAGDYNSKQLEAASAKRPLVGAIVEHWRARAGGRQTIVFAAGLAHGDMIAAEFAAAGIRAEPIHGKQPKAKQRELLEAFENYEYQVLINCQLLVEGIDIPAVKCIVLARVTQSLTVHLQQIGRGTRPFGEDELIVLDHAGNCRVHGLPEAPREWSLEGRPKRTKPTCDGDGMPLDDAPTQTCLACYAVIDTALRICSECGEALAPERAGRRAPRVVDGQLQEMAAHEAVNAQREFWARTCHAAHERGEDLAWVCARFRSKFLCEAPTDWELPPRPARHFTDAEKSKVLAELKAVAYRAGYDQAWVAKRYHARVGDPLPAPVMVKEVRAPVAPTALPAQVALPLSEPEETPT
jgi:superfamily II DNA or RNA helicase